MAIFVHASDQRSLIQTNNLSGLGFCNTHRYLRKDHEEIKKYQLKLWAPLVLPLTA